MLVAFNRGNLSIVNNLSRRLTKTYLERNWENEEQFFHRWDMYSGIRSPGKRTKEKELRVHLNY